jgi:hypothetical protein
MEGVGLSELRKVTLTGTRLDRHNERFAISALDGMVEQIATSYIPMVLEHDPRYPPMGRLVNAEVVALPDGEHELVGTIELFDQGSPPPGDGRTIPLRVEEIARFRVGYDRTLKQNDARGDIEALGKLSGVEPAEMGKKALEPLAVFAIEAGILVAGMIASGFFGKIGSDTYDALKRRLMSRYTEIKTEELLQLTLGVDAGRPIEVLVILSNPRSEDVEELFDGGLNQVDPLVEYATSREAELARIVILFSAGSAKLAYAVRTDGVPVLVDQSLIPPLPESPAEGT